MKILKILDFYSKIMKIREIMHFSPLFRIWGHKYPSKVIKNAYEYNTFSLLAVAMPHFR